MTDQQNQRRLAGPVTVGNRTYQPGDELPDDVAKQISNPKAWASADTAQEQAAAAAGKKAGHPSGARLKSMVTVAGRTYGPADTIPDDVAKQISNPKAWVDGKLPTLGAAEAAPASPSSPDPAPEPDPEPVDEPRRPRGSYRRA